MLRMGIFFRITRIIAYNILHVNINLNLIHMYLSRNGPLLIFLFFHFVVLQLCELPDWRRSVHATGHWERCSEREQKRCCAASEAFLQNRPTTTSKHSILSSHKWTCHWFTVSYETTWCFCCSPCCPLGGPSWCWAPHSLCLELWCKGLPTHQNVHPTGK